MNLKLLLELIISALSESPDMVVERLLVVLHIRAMRSESTW
jgi:hypothetical protein